MTLNGVFVERVMVNPWITYDFWMPWLGQWDPKLWGIKKRGNQQVNRRVDRLTLNR